MARGGSGGGGLERWRSVKWCSYKRATLAVCCVNFVAAVYVVRSLYYGSLHILSPTDTPSPFSDFKYTEDQIKRVEESVRLRKGSVPTEIVKLVRELREEGKRKERRWELTPATKLMITGEILERLGGVNNATNVTEQREAVELWRTEKLKEVKRIKRLNATSNSSISPKEAKILKGALESDWHRLSEDIGLWIPVDVINNEINDKPENGQEPEEEEIIAGPPLPPECHAEPHTDYDGSAVRWGLTHHKDSAADCCQACLDHAKQAKPGEVKCNIWVYCPSEFGCYSPDIYEHRHQECWLKQAQEPRKNFKDKYSESYRNSHPTAPVVVPWISGVTG